LIDYMHTSQPPPPTKKRTHTRTHARKKEAARETEERKKLKKFFRRRGDEGGRVPLHVNTRTETARSTTKRNKQQKLRGLFIYQRTKRGAQTPCLLASFFMSFFLLFLQQSQNFSPNIQILPSYANIMEKRAFMGKSTATPCLPNESHGGTYSGFLVETLPGGDLSLWFCCVMLELGLVVVGREEQSERRGEDTSAKKPDVCRLLGLSVATGTNTSPQSMYRFGLFLD